MPILGLGLYAPCDCAGASESRARLPSFRARGIVHIDWPRDNDHFRIKVANPANLKLVEYVRSDHPENVAKKVGQLAANGAEEILLITRGRLTKPMLAGLGQDVSIHRVSRGVAVVTQVVD